MLTAPWRTFASALVGTLVSLTSSAEDTTCPSYPVGVHEIITGNSKQHISVAKVTPYSDDEGSYLLAQSEARLEARSALMKFLEPQVKNTRFSGLVDVSTCRSNGELYATIKLDEGNLIRAIKMQQLLQDSFDKNPTPAPPN